MSRSTTVPPAPGTATTPAARLARDLAPRLRGTLLLPGEPGYAASLPGHNLAVVHAPALVVRAADADDVAGTVRAAARHGLSVAVRSTGHGLATAGPDDVLLDVSQLSCVAVDPEARTATVGPGARWQQVLDAGAPHGLGGLCGSSPGVGVVGYTLGGGLGPLARAFGLAADHVRSLDVVTPTGERVTVTADRRSDLFWALRGGGGAFGVVTSMTFDLFALSTVRGGAIVYDAADAPAVLRHWRTWTATLPEAPRRRSPG
ncbi:FAD-binding oxidoreductase [Cellulomonas sp. PhB143]|uniref:FAD-binding oxidoreductase n=1 Tax=Cellulomonas sp. PhB143 TaxID=2485186 RepID=UPI000F4A173B|nr:FAD-binding oxidoreductase [Cellulomonas sp. PhB143]